MDKFMKALDFDSDTLGNVKRDMNFVLQRLIGNMMEKGSTNGSLTLKIDVSFTQEYIPNYDPKVEGESRKINKPREIKIYITKELKIGTSSKTQRPASKKSNKKSTTGSKTTTYTIKSGDTLSRIAQKKLGKASRYPEIYKLNKSKIEAAAKKHGRKSSNNGHWIYPGTKLTIPKK